MQELCAREHRYVTNPIRSPDGTAIAFSAAEDEEGTISGLYVLERGNGAIRRLGSVGYQDIFGWHPHSAWLHVVDETEAGIPMDPLISQAGDGGVPLLLAQPASAAATAFRDIARQVKEQLGRNADG